MVSAAEALAMLRSMQVTHVVWVPDSYFGSWETLLQDSPLTLVRVCREGEAWPLAAGLFAGGARPLVVMQTTGWFESGDALRNAVYDLQVPLYAWIGVRNWLNAGSADSARRFAQPLLEAWQLDTLWVEAPGHPAKLVDHYRRCQENGRPGIVLFPEGSG